MTLITYFSALFSRRAYNLNVQQQRAVIIVLDGCGAGEAPDSELFGDIFHPATVKHVWEKVDGFHAPNLEACGFLKACGVDSHPKSGSYGRLRELSAGKDSVTGHWEMMGIITDEPFPTFPNGFPEELIVRLEKALDTHFLGNRSASGTEIIRELGTEHVQTGHPILYTSADSVLQLACHEEICPLERLYEMCLAIRGLCSPPYHVLRVIARPFIGSEKEGFHRTEHRKDYPVEAPHNLVDEVQDVFGIGVVPELFNSRGFRKVVRTQDNKEHEEMLLNALESNARFIFANFEDFDMLYGHRSDPEGFAKCLETFDLTLGKVLEQLRPKDLLILTADHGNDPTDSSTDHTREYVPVCVIAPGACARELGDVEGMSAVGATVASHLGVKWKIGVPLPVTLP